MPWTPPPGGVELEQRKRRGLDVAYGFQRGAGRNRNCRSVLAPPPMSPPIMLGIVGLERRRRDRMTRKNDVAKAWRETLDLMLDPVGHVDVRRMRDMTRSAATSCNDSPRLAVSTTRQPSRANWNAAARPIPLLAPVITTTLPRSAARPTPALLLMHPPNWSQRTSVHQTFATRARYCWRLRAQGLQDKCPWPTAAETARQSARLQRPGARFACPELAISEPGA
jgi:hypothetical protein